MATYSLCACVVCMCIWREREGGAYTQLNSIIDITVTIIVIRMILTKNHDSETTILITYQAHLL